MLLKRADDKSKRVTLLEELQRSTALDFRQKQWLREELWRLRKGIQGEKEAAYFLDQYFKDGENHMVLHDLRFEVEGDVAQIDHLVINRGFGMYLLETKNYAGNVSINAHGEFTVEYDTDRFGVESPIEQSRRHERILHKVLERLEIKARTGAPLICHHLVMFHPKAIITRPAPKAFDTSNVIKADQFPSWHGQFVDKEWGFGTFLKVATNLRSQGTIKEWGEKLIRQHRPANLLALPPFMLPKETVRSQPSSAKVATAVLPPARPIEVKAAEPIPAAQDKRLICLHCSSKISYAEGKFCWSNSARFKGGQYCREHQPLFPR